RAAVVEAVAYCRGAGADARDFEVDDLFAEQSDDALQGADPAQALGGGGGGAPAHRLGPGEGADNGGDRFGEDGGRGSAGFLDDREIDAVALGELVLAEAGLAQEALQRLGRGRGSWALGLLAHRLRLGGQAAGDEGDRKSVV